MLRDGIIMPVAGDEGNGLVKFDMHVHSVYSEDSLNDPAMIVDSYRRTGVLPLVCDHNTTTGSGIVYNAIRKISTDVPLIIAEEVMTRQGEVIGLFLSSVVPAYLDIRETLEIIHGQGGLALLPHPFCSFRGSRLWEDYRSEVITAIDIVEGFNGRIIHPRENAAAWEFAGRYGKPVSVGSDSHCPEDLGRYWLELEPFSTPEELMKSLRPEHVRYLVPKRRTDGE